MSGSISRKMNRKAIRQQSKEEIRWYTKFFAEIIEDEYHERMLFPNSEYTTLSSEQILRLIQGPILRRN